MQRPTPSYQVSTAQALFRRVNRGQREPKFPSPFISRIGSRGSPPKPKQRPGHIVIPKFIRVRVPGDTSCKEGEKKTRNSPTSSRSLGSSKENAQIAFVPSWKKHTVRKVILIQRTKVLRIKPVHMVVWLILWLNPLRIAAAAIASSSSSGLAISALASSSEAATSATTSTEAAAVTVINTSLTESLDVFLLFFTSPFAASRSSSACFQSVLALRGYVVKERGGLIISNQWGFGLNWRSYGWVFPEGRSCNCLFNQVLLVKFGIGSFKVEICCWNFNLRTWMSCCSAPASATSSCKSTRRCWMSGGTDRITGSHFIDLLRQVIQCIPISLTGGGEFGHSSSYSSSSSLGSISQIYWSWCSRSSSGISCGSL